jgi:hypothetical protein
MRLANDTGRGILFLAPNKHVLNYVAYANVCERMRTYACICVHMRAYEFIGLQGV